MARDRRLSWMNEPLYFFTQFLRLKEVNVFAVQDVLTVTMRA